MTMITENDINKAKAELAEATKSHHDAAVNFSNARAMLENAKADGLANGTIEGKNAELREAAARQILGDLYTQQDAMQAFFDAADLRMKLARIEDDRISMIIRLLELAK